MSAYETGRLLQSSNPWFRLLKQVEDSKERRRVHIIVFALDRMSVGKELARRRKVTDVDFMISRSTCKLIRCNIVDWSAEEVHLIRLTSWQVEVEAPFHAETGIDGAA